MNAGSVTLTKEEVNHKRKKKKLFDLWTNFFFLIYVPLPPPLPPLQFLALFWVDGCGGMSMRLTIGKSVNLHVCFFSFLFVIFLFAIVLLEADASR